MNAAKSILALSLYLARKADMELAEVTEEDKKRSKERNDTKTERRNSTEPEEGVPVSATSSGNIRLKGVRSTARKRKGSE